MRSYGNGRLSATTQVKVLSPVIFRIALGQGLHFLEANTGTVAFGETVCGVSGSESVAGKRTVFVGTWESRSVPGSRQGAEEATRWYGVSAVGLTHSRGVGGVMPVGSHVFGTLEGVSGLTLRLEVCHARH
jgi:hypothetical protein